jgi:hypothetical protein
MKLIVATIPKIKNVVLAEIAGAVLVLLVSLVAHMISQNGIKMMIATLIKMANARDGSQKIINLWRCNLKYKKPTILAGSILLMSECSVATNIPAARPCNPPKPSGR